MNNERLLFQSRLSTFSYTMAAMVDIPHACCIISCSTFCCTILTSGLCSCGMCQWSGRLEGQLVPLFIAFAVAVGLIFIVNTAGLFIKVIVIPKEISFWINAYVSTT